jgi:hypothetical protein
MLAMGVVEILAGVLVAVRPAIGGYAGAAWLLGIIVIPLRIADCETSPCATSVAGEAIRASKVTALRNDSDKPRHLALMGVRKLGRIPHDGGGTPWDATTFDHSREGAPATTRPRTLSC